MLNAGGLARVMSGCSPRSTICEFEFMRNVCYTLMQLNSTLVANRRRRVVPQAGHSSGCRKKSRRVQLTFDESQAESQAGDEP